ncbi:hypothetical protein VSDG_08286 [Cytospora chrysosperma]|uniref:Heterokaryon incompatibility domain-containing protein n=1 Tax=Cytospora chrysosperma TaxID=252740 RepID=A0A423VI59_CYTCH|nr:hypothetical protein VSDG_08286 [Valsa sordida]
MALSNFAETVHGHHLLLSKVCPLWNWNLNDILSWLDNCGNDHKYCNTSISALFFPTRVVDVHNIKNGLVVLRDKKEVLGSNFDGGRPEGTYPHYWTLSHRWGDPKKIIQLLGGNPDKGTTSNEEQFRNGISLNEFSPTFRDAMELVDKMGYRYIWIDCLCIFQDSSSDWEQEARMMKDVYENSFCNISAIRSSYDVSLGLFGPRLAEPSLVYPFSVDLELPHLGDGQTEEWTFWYTNLWDDEINRAPLIRRGWVVQERFLARRTIHFARDQIYWECVEHLRCEADPEGRLGLVGVMAGWQAIQKRRGLKDSLRMIIKHLHPELEAPSLWDLSRWSTPQGCWRTIVTTYSSCDLTKESDRLIAISGVAKKFGEVIGGRYLAGLWERGLHTDLMWLSNASQGDAVRPSDFFAPSWSWASICGGNITVAISSPLGFGEPSSLIELIDARFKPKSHNGDPMGLLASAELDIECRPYYFKKAGNLRTLEMYADQALSEIVPQRVELDSLKLDTEELVRKYKQDMDIDVVCVPVYSEPVGHGRVSVKCILLEPNPKSTSSYRRVGVLIWDGIGGSWDSAVRTRITLV